MNEKDNPFHLRNRMIFMSEQSVKKQTLSLRPSITDQSIFSVNFTHG